MVLVRLFSKFKQTSNLGFTIKSFYHKKMDVIYFRYVEPSDRFEISFSYSDKTVNVNRTFNLKRNISETVDDFSLRIKKNIEKILESKAKRKKKTDEQVEMKGVDIKITESGKPLDGSRLCKEVFFNGGEKILFNICGQDYNVLINPPWVESIALPNNLMVGSLVYPYKFNILFGSKFNSKFIWYKSNKSGSCWEEIATGKELLITEDFLDCKVKVICIPGNGEVTGPEIEAVSNYVIKPGPENIPFLERHKYTKEHLPSGSFRVVSYNILADAYAETQAAKTELFPYCPPYALNIDYRKQLIIREILGYNADIICLQEVDARVFKNDLQQVLDEDNYEGVLTRKNGSVAEGVATFYAKRKFRLIETKELSFADEIDKNPIFSLVWEKIKSNEPVKRNFKERTTIFHALVLESLERDMTVVVGNTHLFFFPTADHIRLMQGGMAVLFLEEIVKNLQKSGKKTTLIFCGDMNSTPDCGLFLLMTEKKAPSDLPDWRSDENEIVEGVELSQPFEMRSAYGAPKFTNYTVGFSGCLDYIYYQSDILRLLQAVPLPTEEIVKQHTALPSPVFPSDHVALVADFSWEK